MTDEERARAVINTWDDQFDEDPSRSDPNAKPLEHFIAAAFAAIRKDYQDAVEIQRGSVEIILNTFCQWAKTYQKGKMCEREQHAERLATIREECAKVAEEWGDTCTDYEVNKYLREVAQAIRTGP